MSNDLRFPAAGLAEPVLTALDPLERQIWAHEQVGQLAPFRPQRLALRIEGRRAEELLSSVARTCALAAPLAARFRRLAGGEIRRSANPADALRPVFLRSSGPLDAALDAALAAPLPPLSEGGAAVTVIEAEGALGLVLALHPILADRQAMLALARAMLGAPLPRATAARRPARLREELPWWRAQFEAGYQPVSLPRRHGAEEAPGGGARARARMQLPGVLAGAPDPEARIMAALAVVLARYGSTAALRLVRSRRPEEACPLRPAEDLLPFCVALDPGQGRAEAEAACAAAWAEAQRHAIPSEALVQDRLRHAGAERHPLGPVVLDITRAEDWGPGIRCHARPLPPAQGECLVMARHGADGTLELEAEQAEGLFAAPQAARLLEHLARVLQAQAGQPVALIPLLLRDELDALSAPYPDDAPVDPRAVHQLIADRGAEAPERPAIFCGDTIWSHAELEARANALAHRLIALGVGAEVPVAILVERGPEAVMAILATLKAGGAYIPVEPDHPASRNHHILTDAGVQVVITRDRFADRLPAGCPAAVLSLDGFDPAAGPHADPGVAIHPGQTAYIMYTSGSTGKPKGVAVEHGPLTRHNQATSRVYEMSRESRELPFLPFSSDGGHERWMVPLMEGGSVVIPDGPLWTPGQTLAAMRARGCNNASIPTTYLQQLAEWAEETGEAPPMRLYSFGGEGLAQSTFDLLSRALNAKTLINGYGPTETIMTPMVWKVAAGTRFDGAYAPLGRAVGQRRVYVLDANLMPCPIGVTGEIHLGGDGVARGYVGRPGTTADRFIPDPFMAQLGGPAGGRMYRSGDLGRWREDGTVEFLGRVDHQVKLNGHRIEPGEIEAALLAAPGVSEALVILREEGGEKALVGYVVAPPETEPELLMRHLEARLPAHMLPSAIVVLERMPTNPNAKLDRAALPAPGRTRRLEGVAPATDLERDILAIWHQVLELPGIGVTDDFFACGGRSLTALKVLAALRRLRPADPITIADLFDAPTVRALAGRLSAGTGVGRKAVALRATGSQPMLYCFPGLLVSTREYMRLTDHLGPEQPVTGFLCQSLSENRAMNVSVPEVVAEYVAHIRRESAGRPCAFLGWSWGGLLAWEAARQLAGEIDLRLVGMVDVCDLGQDFAPGAVPRFAPGERARLEAEMQDWLARTRMRPQWDLLIGQMDALCYDQFLRFIGNEADPLPTDGPEVSSREHTFWVLIDNALVFRQHRLSRLEVPVASFSAEDSLSRGLNLVDWRQWSARATAAEIVPGTNHLHIIGDRLFQGRFRARLEAAFGQR